MAKLCKIICKIHFIYMFFRCVGRMDEQVKIHGFRIELEEINNAIRSVATISEVVTVKDVEEEVLVSYVTGSVVAEDIRKALKAILPGYMIPAYIIQLESFPLNSNGKIDKKMLKLATYKPHRYLSILIQFTKSLVTLLYLLF